ncbi:hypothetical protein GCM10009799_32420 [Nocardiopsis rhodophaea]|uniref:Uncharacterized protein n=1 Tax=Nocardiopsis rhodophaea TaxID=280238 RepID=A0ABP5EQX9_9ACTN
MRKHHKRWIALAGATTTSLTAFGVLGGAVALAAETPQPDPRVFEQTGSHYALDGFEITYLPPGLKRYGIRAQTSTKPTERVSFISWIQDADAVYGHVGVIRNDSLKTLDDLRRSRYRHLNDDTLETIDNDGRAAYLSEETGNLFWVEEPGVAVATYLRPDLWNREELTKLGAGVRKQKFSVPESVQNALINLTDLHKQHPDTVDQPKHTQPPASPGAGEQQPDAETPEASPSHGAPDSPAVGDPGNGSADGAAPEDEGQTASGGDTPVAKPGMPLPDDQESSAPALPPGITAERVTACLARDLLDAKDVDATKIGKVDRATFAKIWRNANRTERSRAVTDCAERLNAERSAPEPDSLDELIEAIWALVEEILADLDDMGDSDGSEMTEITTTEITTVTTFDKPSPRNLQLSTANGFPWIVPKLTIGGKN